MKVNTDQRNQCQELASKLKEKNKEMEGIKSHVELLFEKETKQKKQENDTNKLIKKQEDKKDKFIYLT